MDDTTEYEAHVAELEALLAELRSKPRENTTIPGQKGWLKAIQGTIENTEAYREIVRLGREISLEMDQENES